jgi:hypothetical protein
VKRIAALVPGLFLASLFLFTVRADQGTRVANGTFTFSGVGQIDISGQSAFRMHADVSIAGGIFVPQDQCNFLDCVPGTQVNLAARWVGGDLRGSVRLRGKDYILGSEDANAANGDVMFNGSLTLPDFTGSGTVDVSAPFTLTGQVALPGSDDAEPLFGSGIATLQFRQSADGSAWQFVSAIYQFQQGTSTQN